MKTLNLNNIILLTTLFLVVIMFSNSANALCVVDGNGAIVTVSGDSETPVKDDTGDDETAANTATDQCTITPDIYKLNIYKFGLCTADPDLNDLSSCQLFFDQTAGVEVDIQAGVSATLPIPEFYIEPGTYPYLYVLLSSKLGMKWSGTFSNAVDGSSGDGNGGTYCWTSNTGGRASSYPDGSEAAFTTAHGLSLAGGVKTMDCGTAEGTVVTTYELLTKFSEESCSALAANGDKSTFAIEGTGSTRGIPTVSLLTTADAFATTCSNAAKIAWTTALSTPYKVTENSTFDMSIKATAANSLEFSNDSDNDILFIGSGAPRIYLTVTN
ncbi:hypothetical protein CL646_04715 [bacterium]|nr:hypothetical protein [bacterium]|tara:strand:- start:514 stop:1494 length:981 start_codon:yes stop_codon:yes gene_type:complete